MKRPRLDDFHPGHNPADLSSPMDDMPPIESGRESTPNNVPTNGEASQDRPASAQPSGSPDDRLAGPPLGPPNARTPVRDIESSLAAAEGFVRIPPGLAKAIAAETSGLTFYQK